MALIFLLIVVDGNRIYNMPLYKPNTTLSQLYSLRPINTYTFSKLTICYPLSHLLNLLAIIIVL